MYIKKADVTFFFQFLFYFKHATFFIHVCICYITLKATTYVYVELSAKNMVKNRRLVSLVLTRFIHGVFINDLRLLNRI